MTDTPLIDLALWIGEKYPVFPVGDNKRPCWSNAELGVADGEGGFKIATQDPKRIRELFSHEGAVYPAVPMGPMSGLVCVDVDLYKSEAAGRWMADNINILERGRQVKTQSGGRHFIFKYDASLKYPPQLAQDVDVKANGGYIVWAGADGYEVLKANAPPRMSPKLRNLIRTAQYRRTAQKRKRDASGKTEEELQYQIISATDFHEASLDLINHWLKEGVDQDAVLEQIQYVFSKSAASLDDHPRHKDWLSRVKDLPRMVKGGEGKVVRSEISDEELAAITKTAGGMIYVPDEEEIPFVPLSNGADEAPTLNEAIQAIVDTIPDEAFQDPQTPIELTGLVKRLHESLVAASNRVPSNLQLAGALSAMSALVGPTAVIRNGVQGACCTNLYVLALGHTGSGKEDLRTVTSTILAEADREDEAADGAPSDVSFHRKLLNNGGRAALMLDEAGIMAQVLKASTHSHQRLLVSFVMQLYGRGLSRVNAKTYVDSKKNMEAIERPRPTLLMSSTLTEFLAGTSEADTDSGFMNRFVTFLDKELAPRRPAGDRGDGARIRELDQDIRDAVARWCELTDAGSIKHEKSIVLDDDALDLLDAFDRGEVEQKIAKGGWEGATWVRVVENTQRVAGLLAVSDAIMSPIPRDADIACTKAHVETAIEIVTRSAAVLEAVAETSGTATPLSKLQERIVRWLKKQGKPVKRRDVNRSPAMRGLDTEGRDKVLYAMEEIGVISIQEEGRAEYICLEEV